MILAFNEFHPTVNIINQTSALKNVFLYHIRVYIYFAHRLYNVHDHLLMPFYSSPNILFILLIHNGFHSIAQ